MKKVWLKIKGFFIVLFGGARQFEKFMKEHADDAVAIVEQIKWLVDNPMVLALIDIFPGKFGSRAKDILDKIQSVLGTILSGMAVGQTCLDNPDFLERFKCVIEAIRNTPIEDRDEIYQAIGVKYVIERSKEYTPDGAPIKKSQARWIVETKLQEVKAVQAKAQPAKAA